MIERGEDVPARLLVGFSMAGKSSGSASDVFLVVLSARRQRPDPAHRRPLETADHHVLGTLCVFDTYPREWPAGLIQALEDLARATVTEIELRGVVRALRTTQQQLQQSNADLAALHSEADERSRHDAMTGLLNRRGFLAGPGAVLDPDHDGAVLVFVDLDGLKRINDVHGHEAGDAAIVAAARLLRSTFRKTDVVARLGGDELVVLLPATGAACAEALIARVHAEVAARNAASDEPGKLALSVGWVARRVGEPVDMPAMLAEADAQMYAMKRLRPSARSTQGLRNATSAAQP